MRLPPRCARGCATLLVLLGACSQQTADSQQMAPSEQRQASQPATQKPDSASVRAPGELPDPYRAPALGMAFQKPSGWIYLPETNHPDPLAWEKRLSASELRRTLRDLSKPVVAIARPLETGAGITPKVSFFYRVASEPDFLQEFYTSHPEAVSQTHAQQWLTLPDAEISEPPRLTPVGGLPGAEIRLRYSETDAASGNRSPVGVRIWNTRRDQGYFYVEAVLPDPATSELEREVEALLSSYRLDPPLSPAALQGSPSESSPQDG